MRSFFVLLALFITLGFVSRNLDSEIPFQEDKAFAAKMDEFAKQVTESLNLKMGIGMAVVRNNHIVYETYQGMANVEKGISVTPKTNFYIASSTKSFTALAMLSLHEKGLLNLDRSLASFFPEYKFKPELKADKINLRDLLYHTSGIENNNIAISKAYTGLYSSQSLVESLVNQSDVDPRSEYGKFRYTNLGYNIVELILERELNKDWKTIVQQEVLSPLGMSKTSANISDIDRYQWQGAEPYQAINLHGTLQPITLKKKDSIMHAAGGLISTPRDMAKFLIAELNSGKVNGKQVFKEKMIKLSQEPHAKQERNFLNLKRYAYGYGWNIATTPHGDTLFHHYGTFPGTCAQVSFMPQYNVGLSICANESQVGLLATFLISSYAFDYFAERKDLDKFYKKQLKKYKNMIEKGFLSQAKNKEKRSKRQWMLDLPKRDYAGKYYNKSTGVIAVMVNDKDEMKASIGYLSSPPFEPFTKQNSVRVEMIPGSGSVFLFEVENGQVTALLSDGLKYEKIN